MFNFFKKKQNNKEVVVNNNSRFDGKIYKGIWRIGDKEIVGAYKRDGWNTFITEEGLYMIPKGTKKTELKRLNDEQLRELGVNVGALNDNLEGLEKHYCQRFLSLDDL